MFSQDLELPVIGLLVPYMPLVVVLFATWDARTRRAQTDGAAALIERGRISCGFPDWPNERH